VLYESAGTPGAWPHVMPIEGAHRVSSERKELNSAVVPKAERKFLLRKRTLNKDPEWDESESRVRKGSVTAMPLIGQSGKKKKR